MRFECLVQRLPRHAGAREHEYPGCVAVEPMCQRHITEPQRAEREKVRGPILGTRTFSPQTTWLVDDHDVLVDMDQPRIVERCRPDRQVGRRPLDLDAIAGLDHPRRQPDGPPVHLYLLRSDDFVDRAPSPIREGGPQHLVESTRRNRDGGDGSHGLNGTVANARGLRAEPLLQLGELRSHLGRHAVTEVGEVLRDLR